MWKRRDGRRCKSREWKFVNLNDQYILPRLRTNTQPLIAQETDSPLTIPTTRGQRWQVRASCSGLTQLVRSWESLACLQLCSCAVSPSEFIWSILGFGSFPAAEMLLRLEKDVFLPSPCWTYRARVVVVTLVAKGLASISINTESCKWKFATFQLLTSLNNVQGWVETENEMKHEFRRFDQRGTIRDSFCETWKFYFGSIICEVACLDLNQSEVKISLIPWSVSFREQMFLGQSVNSRSDNGSQ